MKRDLLKTASFAVLHFGVAFTVTYTLTGSVTIATSVGLIEPLANTVAFYFHERAWRRVDGTRAVAKQCAGDVLRDAEGGMNDATRGEPAGRGVRGPDRSLPFVLRAVLRATLSRTFRAGLPVEQQRRRLLRGNAPDPAAARRDVRGCDLRRRARRVGPRPRPRARGTCTVLYLHGGGYCAGSPATHRALTGHLAARCSARVFAPTTAWRPEHPFPAAVDDAVAAYRGLLGEGVAPGDIVIAGDSAGGGLAVATALRLRELGAAACRARWCCSRPGRT